MSNVYFASDLHLGHKGICKYRTRFANAHRHDLYVMENLLASVNKRDTLWLLGDTFMSAESIKYFYEIAGSVGQLNLIFGNHCTDAKRGVIVQEIVESGLVNRYGALFSKYRSWIVHVPIHPTELRHKRCIHGHIHASVIDDNRYINVNVDVNDYKPVSLEKLGTWWEDVGQGFVKNTQ